MSEPPPSGSGDGAGRLRALHPRPGGAERAAVDVRRPDAGRDAGDRARRAADRARLRPHLPHACRARRPGSAPRCAGRRCPTPSSPSCARVTAADGDGADALVVLARPAAVVPRGGGPDRRRARAACSPAARAPLDPETDRVLVRSAANVVGTTLETANVLEVARRKDDFLAMLGHELRNPLAPILTAVELLARQSDRRPRAGRDRAAHAPPRAAGRRPARHLARHARPRRAAQRAGVAGVGARARGGDRRPARVAPSARACRSRPPRASRCRAIRSGSPRSSATC